MKENKTYPANTQSTLWLAIINDKKEATTEQIEATLKQYQLILLNYKGFHYVFTIIHNKDPEKRTHLHAVIELHDKKTLKAVLSLLSTLLMIDTNQISLEPTNNEFLCVQYLTHKNNQEKEPYDYKEIKTNNESELKIRYEAEYVSPEERKKALLFGSKTIMDLLQNMTIDEAKKVLPVFKAIKEEQGYDKKGLIDQLNKMRTDYQFLYDLTQKVFDILTQHEDFKNDQAKINKHLRGLMLCFEDLLPF